MTGLVGFGLLGSSMVAHAIDPSDDAQDSLKALHQSVSLELARLKHHKNAQEKAGSVIVEKLQALANQIRNHQRLLEDVGIEMKKLRTSKSQLSGEYEKAVAQLQQVTRLTLAMAYDSPMLHMRESGGVKKLLHKNLMVRSTLKSLREMLADLSQRLTRVTQQHGPLEPLQQKVIENAESFDPDWEQACKLSREVRGLKYAKDQAPKLSFELEKVVLEAPKETQLSLQVPVGGEVFKSFQELSSQAPNADGQRVLKGVLFKAGFAEPVVAPAEAVVAFAGTLYPYGKLVILAHPEGYHTLLAGLGDIKVKLGQTVKAGQKVGAAISEPTAHRQEAILLVELRRDGVAIDPLPLFQKFQNISTKKEVS